MVACNESAPKTCTTGLRISTTGTTHIDISGLHIPTTRATHIDINGLCISTSMDCAYQHQWTAHTCISGLLKILHHDAQKKTVSKRGNNPSKQTKTTQTND